MISKAIDYGSKFVSVALGFSIPVSTALNSIFLVLIVPLWLLGRNYKEKLSVIKDNKYIWVLFILLGLYFAGLFYGDAGIVEAASEFKSMAYLLLIPMFIPFFRDKKVRDNALNIFMLLMTITLFISYLIWFDLVPPNPLINKHPKEATVFMLRITQNLLMAFSAFLFAVRARQSADWGKRLLFIILSILAVINVTVVVGGKTGYVVLMVLTVYYFLDWLKWRGLFFAVLAIALFGLFTYLSPSGRMYDSIQKMYTEITQNNITEKSADEIENYSTGQRIMFYKNTMKIIAKHPVFGVGTGGYTRAYSEVVKDTKMPVTDNPHNEYLMVTSQLGLVGLCSFLFLFFMQWRLAADLHSIFDKMVARGLVLTILSASMVSSTLIDHTERTLYIWMTALLFGGYISGRHQEESKNEIISNNNNEK